MNPMRKSANNFGMKSDPMRSSLMSIQQAKSSLRLSQPKLHVYRKANKNDYWFRKQMEKSSWCGIFFFYFFLISRGIKNKKETYVVNSFQLNGVDIRLRLFTSYSDMFWKRLYRLYWEISNIYFVLSSF